MNQPRGRPPSLVLSCALGVVGVLLLVAGALADVEALFVAGFVAGALSLGAALYWRSELIAEWRQRER